MRKIMIFPRTGGWSKAADSDDSSIHFFMGHVSENRLRLDLQLGKEGLKPAKIFPLAGWITGVWSRK